MLFWNTSARTRLYADAAASTPLSPSVRAELERLLPLFGNPGALHQEALRAKAELEAARQKIATAIGAHADELIFTGSGTEANNLAVFGTLRPLLRAGHIHAITSAIEHSSILEPLHALQKEGVHLTELPVDSEGFISATQLAEASTDATVFVSIQLVNSEVGTIEPVHDLAKVLRRADRKIYFHSDASQAPLWLKIGVEKLGVDLLTLDAQKISGPKGIGLLYRKRGTALAPLIYGGGQEAGLRSGTENVPLACAFAVALEEAQQRVIERAQKIAAVRDYLWTEIKTLIPEAVLLGPHIDESSINRVANNLNISIPALDGQMAVIALDALGIATSTRSACTTGQDVPSHVLVALGTPPTFAKSALRITLLPSATKGDAVRIARALQHVADRYKIIV